MARLICRLPWNQPVPSPDAANQADVEAWLLPCRWTQDEQLQLGHPLEQLTEAFPETPVSLECEFEQALSPLAEQRWLQALNPLLRHPSSLRVGGRPLLWIRQPEQLSHPLFTARRLRHGLTADALVLAAGPPLLEGWDGLYEVRENLPCQRLRNGLENYESLLFHAHHHPDPGGRLVVPCVRGDGAAAMAHSSPQLYREWLLQASAWCDLRHSAADERLVLVEHWDDHQQWWTRPEPPQAAYPDAIKAVERRWGPMEARQPALLIHGFHLDLLEAILKPLAPGATGASRYALYVSTPQQQLDAVERLIRQQGWPGACLVGVENRGRDIAPFLLELLPRASATGHPWLVKLHTKRSFNKPGGRAWGEHLLGSLASPEALATIAQRFSDEQDPALLVPRGSLIANTVHMAGNQAHLRQLLERHALPPLTWMNQMFAAGSMWAARTEALAPLLAAPLSLQHFEAEQAQTDGTLAHAWERLIPAVLKLSPGRVQELSEPSADPPPFGYAWAGCRRDS